MLRNHPMLTGCFLAALSPAPAYASVLPPEFRDKAAEIVAGIRLMVVPIVAIVVFCWWVATDSDTQKAPDERVSQAAG